MRFLLVILVIYNNCVQSTFAGRYCFNCQDNSNLASCTRVTICGPHEECFIEKVLADDGVVYFSQGCRDRQMCNTLPGKRSDITACQECCDSDFCNYKGCNEYGIKPDIFNHLCLNCGDSLLDADNKCHKVSACRRGTLCSVTTLLNLNGDTAYQFGCKAETDCGNIQNPGHCNKCCRGPFCNYECSSVGGLLASTVGLLNIPTTTPGWNIISRPMITTTPPLWQHIPSRFKNTTACFTCKDVSTSSDCTDFTHCGEHEQCYIQTSVTPGGITLLSGGCTDKSVCNAGFVQGSSNTIICYQCCNSDFCNMNGCGQSVGSSELSHFCVTCQGAIRPEDCKKISRCTTHQQCMIQPSFDLNGKHTVDMGCAGNDFCRNLPDGIHSNDCTGCCTGAYCNKDCRTFNNKKSHHHIDNHVTVSQSHVTVTPYHVTTAVPRTTTSTNTVGVSCYHCEFVTYINDCHTMTTCNSGEVCQLKELTGSNGMVAYRMRCINMQTCWQSGPHSRVGCCNKDRCNSNLDILT